MVGRDTPEPIRSGTPCKPSLVQAVVVEPRIPRIYPWGVSTSRTLKGEYTMPKKNNDASEIPALEREIWSKKNVPVALAAQYLGMSSDTIYAGLQDERMPFGFGVYKKATETWTYHISPGALVKYRNGELPAYRLREVQKIFVEGAEQLLNTKLQGLSQIVAKVCGV